MPPLLRWETPVSLRRDQGLHHLYVFHLPDCFVCLETTISSVRQVFSYCNMFVLPLQRSGSFPIYQKAVVKLSFLESLLMWQILYGLTKNAGTRCKSDNCTL